MVGWLELASNYNNWKHLKVWRQSEFQELFSVWAEDEISLFSLMAFSLTELKASSLLYCGRNILGCEVVEGYQSTCVLPCISTSLALLSQ